MLNFKNSLLLFFIVFFLGCTKYPENTLWNEPKKVFKGGKITSFTSSGGVDLMQDYRDMYKNFPYNFYGQSIPDVFALEFTYDPGGQNIKTDYGDGTFKFSKNNKEVEIKFYPKNYDAGAKNMFFEDLNWRILKLTDKGQLKIQASYNLRIYEIQFN